MIKRFVKLTIREECQKDFLKLFELSKHTVLASKGCRHLELLRDIDNNNVFITFSIWDSEDDLVLYRNTQAFMKIWEEIGKMFDADPEAHSTEHIG